MIVGLIGAVLAAGSAWVLWILGTGARAVRRDEFNRTNSAGVLEYASYEEAEKARRRKAMLEAFAIMIPISFCGVIAGIILIVMAAAGLIWGLH